MTRSSAGHASMARPRASPNFRQRRGVGRGCCTVFTQIGIVRTGHAGASGHNSCMGTTKPWSTSISWQVVRSKSAAERLSMRCQESAVSPETAAASADPSLVGIVIFTGGADREGGHLVEKEVEAVIVVDDYGDGGTNRFEAGAHRLVGFEEWPPVRVVAMVPRHGKPDGRNVRGADSADDARHVSLLPRAAWRGIPRRCDRFAGRRCPAR
jgi:hypothetical protein